jgi:hypothetical protein
MRVAAPAATVGDLDHDGVDVPGDTHDGPGRAGVADDVRRRLLHHPVGGGGDVGWQGGIHALEVDADRADRADDDDHGHPGGDQNVDHARQVGRGALHGPRSPGPARPGPTGAAAPGRRG